MLETMKKWLKRRLLISASTSALLISLLPFAQAAVPTITSASPTTINANAGGLVTITGSEFTGTTEVDYGTTSVTFSVVNDTTISFTAPPSINLGAVDVKVINPSGSKVLSNAFTYVVPTRPTVTSISPTSVNYNGGGTITITGTNLPTNYSWCCNLGTTLLSLGNTGLSVTSATSTRVVATIPNASITSGNLVFQDYFQTTTFENIATITQPSAPTITSLSTTSGSPSGGYSTTITGTGFLIVNRVSFNGNYVYVTPMSDTQMTVNVPASGSFQGKVDVSVFNSWNSATLTNGFEYIGTTPTITSIDTTTGTVAGGTQLTLTGTDLLAISGFVGYSTNSPYNSYLKFGNAYVNNFVSTSNTQLVFKMPPGTSATTVDATLWNGWHTATLSNAFTYLPIPSPTITSISPTSVSMLTQPLVTVTGKNLENVTSIQVGGNTVGYSSRSATQLTFNAPQSLFSGSVDVKVLTASDSATVTNGLTYAAIQAPTITSLDVNSGSALGGTQIIVTGSGFLTHYGYYSGNSTPLGYGFVRLGSQWIYPKSFSDTSIIFTTGSNSTLGAADLTIGNFWASTTLSNAFTFLKPPSPTITSLSTSSGPASGRTVVSIAGTNLERISTVKFGSTNANIQAQSATQLTLVTPAVSSAGVVDVTVFTTFDSATATSAFTFTTPAAPSVTSVSPITSLQSGGIQILINGSGFASVSGYTNNNSNMNYGYVQIGGSYASVSSFTDTQITAVVPASASAVSADVIVGNYWTSATLINGFTYTLPPAPTLTSITPNTGAVDGSTNVVVVGTGFSTNGYCLWNGPTPSGCGVVRVNGQLLSPSSYSATQINFNLPAGSAAGPIDFYVWNGWTSSVFTSAFTYSPAPAPTITSVSPSSVRLVGQQQITITGTNLAHVNAVRVGGNAANVISATGTQVVFNAPGSFFAGAQDVQVLTSSDSALSANALTYLAAAQPSISSLSTSRGSAVGGSQVTVTGSGFLTHYSYTSGSNNLGYGYIKLGTQWIYPDSWSDSSITFTTPTALAVGPVDLIIGNYWNSTTLTSAFTFTSPPKPTISSVSPASGSAQGGAVFSIIGTNLGYINTIKFGSVATSPRATSTTQLTVVVPASSVTGLVDIQVLNNWDSATATASFTYVAPEKPTITSVSPASGPLSGGTQITLTGTGFNSSYGYSCWGCGRIGDGYLMVGGQYANVSSYSDTQITAIVPVASSAGQVDIVVGNYWSSTTSANAFTYTTPDPPTITSVSPSVLSMVRSSVVTILGSNLSQVQWVLVGTQRIYVRAVSDSQLTFNSPVSLFSGQADLNLNTSYSSTNFANKFTFSELPTLSVSSISPTSGLATGGTSVTISGTGFLTQYGYCGGCGAGYGYVKFGNNYANVSTYTDTSLTVDAPVSSVIGAVDVVVGNFWSNKKLSTQFTYTAPDHPTITSISPNMSTALGGGAVTITGTHLSSITRVLFGDIYANIQAITDTRILLSSPTSLVVGAVDVKISNPWETVVSRNGFTYSTPASPVITSVTPNTGSVAGGSTVRIVGSGFLTPYGYGCWGCGSGYGYVKFGGTYASVQSYTDTEIFAEVPQKSATGVVDISVGNAWSSTTVSGAFTYLTAPTPTITSISQTTFDAAGGTTATLVGTNFYGINAIYIGNTYIRFSVNSPTQILLNIGIINQSGLQDLRLVTRWTTVTKEKYITITAPAAPVITSVTPNTASAAGGSVITIAGSNLAPIYDYSCWGCAGYNYVTIGGNFATVTSFSDTQITAIVPQSSVIGTVDVAVSSAWAQSKLSSAFTYTAPPKPQLTSIYPSSGTILGGTSVTITGTGLMSSGYKILIGKSSWTGATSSSDTSLTFITPVGVDVGAQDISLYNAWGSTTFSKVFTYTAAAAPSITSISPAAGSAVGGFEITVNGTGFASAYGFTTNCIGCLGYNTLYVGDTPVEVTRYTDSQIVGTVPQISRVGSVDVSVRNSWTSVTFPSALQLTKPADVHLVSLTPITVDASGGYTVTLNGSNLSTVSTVMIGTESVKFAIVSENQIIVYSPYSPVNSTVNVTASSLWSNSVLPNSLTFTGGGPVPPDGQIGLSINAGDRFTANRNVKLNLVWPAGATTAYISNDGGFSNALTLVKTLQTEVDWQLDPPGVVPLPAIVYVRYNYNDTTYFDDIIIDAVSPILTYASATG